MKQTCVGGSLYFIFAVVLFLPLAHKRLERPTPKREFHVRGKRRIKGPRSMTHWCGRFPLRRVRRSLFVSLVSRPSYKSSNQTYIRTGSLNKTNGCESSGECETCSRCMWLDPSPLLLFSHIQVFPKKKIPPPTITPPLRS